MADQQGLDGVLSTLEEVARRQKFRKIDFFIPYPKQSEFFDLGATKRERLLMAGNQLGKTEAGAVEATYHLTGEYPDDWMGRRFDYPTRGWIDGETSLLVRDVQQKKLCGPPGVEDDFGSGYIPREAFIEKPSLSRGVTDAYDTIQVRHKSGGISTATFKSYEQGRAKHQGEPVDWIWLDEEPPMDIYSECLTRTTATNGLVYLTFTPLLGMSDVVIRYLNEASEDRGVVTMTISDALHITPEQRKKIIAGYPAHEREARSLGVPMLGSGRIFQITEEAIMEPGLTYVPAHWFKLWGVDFGIDHPFGAVLILWDKDNDVIHVHEAFRMAGSGDTILPINHAARMKPIGASVPVAWPQDGTARSKNDGEPLSKSYKQHGLMMLPDHATWPEGGVSTEKGILEMQERMTTGRLKVANHLSEWFDEYRMYHRKDGQIVKVKDDILSATRVAIMMKRYARAVPLGGPGLGAKRRATFADGIDFDVFA